MPTISAIVITKNEAKDIRDCLESIKWVDEIVVLDSGSKDDTLSICHEYTTRVYQTDWPGFGLQKNRALKKATGDWILSIDADERVPEALKQEIQQAIQQTELIGFHLPRQSYYCGRAIKHLRDWRRDAPLRLIKKGCGEFSDDIVHERIIPQGKTSHLQSKLIHLSYQDLEEVLEKVNRYSSDVATLKFKKGKKGGLGKALLHGIWSFLRAYVFGLGFLDGREGFILSVSNAETSYYRYIKLMYLHEKETTEK